MANLTVTVPDKIDEDLLKKALEDLNKNPEVHMQFTECSKAITSENVKKVVRAFRKSYMKLQPSQDVAKHFLRATNDRSSKEIFKMCIFSKLVDVYFNLRKQGRAIKTAAQNNKTVIDPVLKTLELSPILIDDKYEISRFTGDRFAQSIKVFEQEIKKFGDSIFLPSSTMSTVNSTDKQWLLGLYILSIGTDVNIKDTFNNEYISTYLNNVDKLILKQEIFTVKKLEVLSNLNINNSNTNNSNTLLLNIYTRTYKLILGDLLRAYTMCNILQRCIDMKECAGVKSKDIEKRKLDLKAQMVTLHNTFVDILNNTNTGVLPVQIVDINTLEEEIKLDSLNNPFIVKLSSVAGKILALPNIGTKLNTNTKTNTNAHKNKIKAFSNHKDYSQNISNILTQLNVKNSSKIKNTPPQSDILDVITSLHFPQFTTDIGMYSTIFGNDNKTKRIYINDLSKIPKLQKYEILNQDYYLSLIELYESLSNAVRVYVKIRDDNISDDNIDFKDIYNWSYKGMNLEINDSLVKFDKNEYGPFYKIVPPYYYNLKKNRMNNKILAEDYFNINENADLICNRDMNLVLLTYGYSGSGKTYSLFGNFDKEKITNWEDLAVGSVYRFLAKIMEKKDVSVKLEDIKVLYGKKAIISENLYTFEESNPEDFQSLIKDLIKEVNDAFINTNQKNIVDKMNLLRDVICKIIEKKNKQALYDKLVLELVNEEKFNFILNYYTPNNKEELLGIFNSGKDISIKKRDLFSKIFDGIDNKTLFIKSTPNNPNSSRGFLFFVFSVSSGGKNNKVVIVDMAGNEDPYDILLKTLPTTIRLPVSKDFIPPEVNVIQQKGVPNKDQGIPRNFLNSEKSYEYDIVLKTYKESLVSTINELLDSLKYPIVVPLSLATNIKLQTFIPLVYGYTTKSSPPPINFTDKTNVNWTDFGRSRCILNPLLSKDTRDRMKKLTSSKSIIGLDSTDPTNPPKDYYNISRFKKFPIFTSNSTFEVAIKFLNYDRFRFVYTTMKNMLLYVSPNLYTSSSKSDFEKLYRYNINYLEPSNMIGIKEKVTIMNLKFINELNKMGIKTKKLEKLVGTSVFDILNTTMDCILDYFRVESYFDNYYYLKAENGPKVNNKVTTNCMINNDELLTSVVCLYNLIDEIDTSAINLKDIKNRVDALQMHKETSSKIDDLYFNMYKQSPSSVTILEEIENLAKIRYFLEFIMTSPIFNEGFSLAQCFASNDNSKYINILNGLYPNNSTEKPFYYVKDKVQSKHSGTMKKVSPEENEVCTKPMVNINNPCVTSVLKLEEIFKNFKRSVIRYDTDTKYSVITNTADYFKCMIDEGFYINQANYELIKHLEARAKNDKPNDGSINPSIDDITQLAVDKYNPNESLGGTKTSIVQTLFRDILKEGDANQPIPKKTKIFMIANIRPEMKFRQGAINTIELVKGLTSS